MVNTYIQQTGRVAWEKTTTNNSMWNRLDRAHSARYACLNGKYLETKSDGGTTSMLEKIKGLGVQVATKANDAIEGITASVKGGVESLTNTATTVTDALNEKAVRASTAQMCSILEIAIEELKSRPLSAQPVSLTATVNIGIASLEMQIHLQPTEKENVHGIESNELPNTTSEITPPE